MLSVTRHLPTDLPRFLSAFNTGDQVNTVVTASSIGNPVQPNVSSINTLTRPMVSFRSNTILRVPKPVVNHSSNQSVRGSPVVTEPQSSQNQFEASGPSRQVILEVALNHYNGCKRSIISTLQGVASTVLCKTYIS